jgi:monoamine oxidase
MTPPFPDLDRRAALGLGVLGAAAVATHSYGQTAASGSASRAVDVVVVGAGFAGLTVARNLRKAGASVVVLEADARVGGRTKVGRVAGQIVDLGGQWVGPHQRHLLALAAELGVKSYPQYVDGKNVLELVGKQFRYAGETPPLEPRDLEEFAKLVGEVDGLAGKVDIAAPWKLAGAGALDDQTVESWVVAATTSEPVRSFFRVFTRALFCVEPGQISMLALLHVTAAAGGVGPMLATRGGSQDAVFAGSVWQMADMMTSALGDAVVLNAPVRSITQTARGVTVTSEAGVWTGALAVVTAPPPMAARIDYTPPMPPRRDALTQHMAMGNVIKVHVAYATPFWRAKGLSGQIFSDQGATCMWFDMAYPETKVGGLVGFFVGRGARVWAERTPDERRARVLQELASYLGPEAGTPIDYVEQVWAAQPWQRGGYMAVPGPGALTAYGPAMREPVGRIHWAGTETADQYVGYIDGAIQSGERVAADCLKRLRP